MSVYKQKNSNIAAVAAPSNSSNNGLINPGGHVSTNPRNDHPNFGAVNRLPYIAAPVHNCKESVSLIAKI